MYNDRVWEHRRPPPPPQPPPAGLATKRWTHFITIKDMGDISHTCRYGTFNFQYSLIVLEKLFYE